MKILGKVLLIVGMLVAFFAMFIFDTTVMTKDGRFVNNIGLMSDQQNLIIFGGFIFIAGLLMILLGKSNAQSGMVNCNDCKELVHKEAIVCKHCGSKLSPKSLEVTKVEKIKEAKKMIECEKCLAVNEFSNTSCWKCNENLTNEK
jgi:hypothetical protein